MNNGSAIDLRKVTHLHQPDGKEQISAYIYFDNGGHYKIPASEGRTLLEAWKKYHTSLMSMDALLDAAQNGKALNE